MNTLNVIYHSTYHTAPVVADQEDRKCSVKVVHLRKRNEECPGSTDF